jgi:hypothetical protein
MKTFNNKEKTDKPIIFNTYQCYLKDTNGRVKIDLDRANRNNFHFACKTVRGAYMNAERARAAERGYPSPVCDSEQDTHDNYNETVRMLIEHRAEHVSKRARERSGLGSAGAKRAPKWAPRKQREGKNLLLLGSCPLPYPPPFPPPPLPPPPL